MTTTRPDPVPRILMLAAVAGALALALRIGLLGAAEEFDELYHLIAARGWVETGAPQILDGAYWRGSLFTRTVAGLFRLTGDDGVATARLVSVAAGILIPVVLVAWLMRAAGPWPALVAGAFAVAWPQGILEAQFVRFYAAHVLFFLSGAAALFLALDMRGRWRLAFLAGAAISWALALHFQVSTAIGIAGALLGAVAPLALDYARTGRRRIPALGIGLCLLGVAAALALVSGVAEKGWAFYRWTPDHAADLRDYRTFYFDQLERSYGILWYATPALFLLALWANARLALYCGVLFGTCFIAHSFGGMKSLRYLSYAMPVLFALWALGLVTVVRWLAYRIGRRPAMLVAVLLTAAHFLVSPFAARSLQLATGQGLPPRGDWRNAAEIVGEWRDAPFVVTTRELHQIAHLGPYDLLISRSRVTELQPPQDFGIDPRTGRPVIGSVGAVARVLDCRADGLLVTSPHWWETEGWGAQLLPLFAARGYDVEIRSRDAVRAVRWRGDPAGATVCDAPGLRPR